MTDRVYFKKNANYNIGVRIFPSDWNGVVLTEENPYVGIDTDKIKDFKRANRVLIEKGMLIQSDEPSTDYENANLLSDEEVTLLVKGNVLKLKKRLNEISSDATVGRILEEARLQNKGEKTINMIMERMEQLGDDGVTPLTMRGVE